MQRKLTNDQKIDKIKSILEQEIKENSTPVSIIHIVKKIAAIVYDISDDELNSMKI